VAHNIESTGECGGGYRGQRRESAWRYLSGERVREALNLFLDQPDHWFQ
jgi:hypothetical protein